MTQKFKFITLLCTLCLCGAAAQAAPGIIVTKDAITLSSQYSTSKQGELYSVDLYDDTYTAENPYQSLIYRNQGITGTEGWWSMYIPMSGEEYGVYRVATGEATGVSSAVNVLYDGFDGEKTYSHVAVGEDKSLSIVAGSYIETDFSELIADTTVNISFDITLEANSQVYMRLNNRKNATWDDKTQIFDTLMFRADGKLGLFTNLNNWNLAPGLYSYKSGTTYHIDLYVDMFRHTIAGYVEGELFGEMPLNEGLEKLGGFKITCSVGGATVTNLESAVISQDEDNSLFFDAKSTAKVGNIYFDESNVSFNMSVLNRENKNASYNLTYEFYNAENDELIGRRSETLNLSANEKKEFVKSFDFNSFNRQYGLFKLKLKFSEVGNESNSFSDDFRFSVAKEATEKNSKMGVHTQFGHGYGNAEKNIYILDKAGFSSVRDYVSWVQYNAENNWTLPERYTTWDSLAQDANMSEIIQIDPFPDDVRDLDGIKEYAVKLAKNSNAEYFELFNELNLSSAITTEEYATVLVAVSDAIKNAAPEKKIVAMVTARTGSQAQGWIEEILEIIENKGLNPRDYIDAISVHPYKLYNLAPEVGTIPDKGEYDGTLHEQVQGVREIMDAHSLADCPIFATEIGWTANPVWSSWARVDDRVTEKQQAEYSIRGSVLLYDDLETMYWHTLNNKINRSDYEDNFGLTKTWAGIEIPFEAKPAFLALANFNAILANAEKLSEITSGKCHAASFLKGNKIHVLWSENESDSYTLNSDSKLVRVYDIYGNSKIYSSDYGIFDFALSTSPIYVEELAEFTDLKLTGDETALKAELVSSEKLSGKYYIFCTSYKDGRLQNAAMKQLEDWNGGKIATDLISISDADTVKAFLWNDNLKPILEYVISK